MKKFFNAKRATVFLFFVSLLCIFPLFPSCKKQVDPFSYVSELRDNIFLAETDAFSLKIYSVIKETPYFADGIKQETTRRTEVYLLAPEGNQNYSFTVTVGGKPYGGEMSFDNVKTEYYWSCTLDVSALSSLDCVIAYETERVAIKANSVLSGKELAPKAVLRILREENQELFSSLTDKYGFAGEIYIRLIYEENTYYYVGIIDRKGKIHAFLLNATTGKTLAKRETSFTSNVEAK